MIDFSKTSRRGQLAVRAAIAKSLGLNGELAYLRWGDNSKTVEKAAVSPLALSDGLIEGSAASDLFAAIAEQSIVGQLALRQVALNAVTLKIMTGALGYWVGQIAPKPLSKPVLDGFRLTPRKVCAIIVQTAETVRLAGLEDLLRADVVRALAYALDQAFIDSANTGSADIPIAVTATSGVATELSSGTVPGDLETLISGFAGDLTRAAIVTDPLTALRIHLSDPGVHVDIGVRGGTLAGLPVIVSRASPRDSSGGQLALVDPGLVAFAADGAMLDSAGEATLEMSDSPNGAGTQVSLFQKNLIGLRGDMLTNWLLMDPAGCSVVTGVDYGQS
jgi:Phage capsid family